MLEKLGAGGMGVVYAAYDPELDRKVAVKLLHPHAGTTKDSDGHRRLVREAQAMAKLSHPNVITVHDVGEHEGRVFVAMEFVEGETLGAWLKQDRSWTEVLDVFVRAGRGLSTAHEKGLVHRDFKPENVMMGADGRVRVMDFGLARASANASDDAVTAAKPVARGTGSQTRGVSAALTAELTRQGAIMGTPAYMAPEQHLGEPTDARTDQFSFCVALWEGLYGERPFAGETTAALALNVTEGIARDVPARAKAAMWLRPLLKRGLAVAAENRWPDLAGLLDALERGAARHRRRWVWVIGGALAVAGLGLVGGWQLNRERHRSQCLSEASAIEPIWNDDAKRRLRDAAISTGTSYASSTFDRTAVLVDQRIAAWKATYGELCFATEVERRRSPELWRASQRCLDERRGELTTLLEVFVSDPDASSVQRMVTAVARLGRSDSCADDATVGRSFGLDDQRDEPQRAALRQRLWQARALLRAGRYDDGLALADQLRHEASKLGSPRLDVETTYLAGMLAEETAAYERAATLLKRAFGVALGAGEDDLALDAATQLAFVIAVRLAQFEQAELWGLIARGLHARAGAAGDLAEAALENNLGSVARDQGRLEQAEQLQSRALAIRERLLPPDHPVIAAMHNNLGNLYAQQGRYEDATRALRRALEIFEQVLGSDHPDVAMAQDNLGTVYRQQGRYDEAVRTHLLGLAGRQQALGPDHPDVGRSLANLGSVYATMGELGKAERAFESSRAIFDKAGIEGQELGQVLINLGNLYRMRKRHEDAERVNDRAHAVLTNTFGPDHPQLAFLYGNRGRLYQVMGRPEEAERAYQLAISIRERKLGPGHPELAITVSNLGQFYLGQGRLVEAEHFLTRSLAMFDRMAARDDLRVAIARHNLADAYRQTGRLDRAELELSRAVTLFERGLGPNHEKSVAARAALAAVRKDLNGP